jgi:hypothetical protein
LTYIKFSANASKKISALLYKGLGKADAEFLKKYPLRLVAGEAVSSFVCAAGCRQKRSGLLCQQTFLLPESL